MRPSGSSPRTRGTPEGVEYPEQKGRFIPAYTGNSRSRQLYSDDISVHPRVHGELNVALSPTPTRFGSSPRTRGTPDRSRRPPPENRFIPAYTGNSRHLLPTRVRGTVHPRVHGELPASSAICWSFSGSSPRTRGTRIDAGATDRCDRFIPAYTGNSASRRPPGCRSAVHPRVHGELNVLRKTDRPRTGSSPRTRGTHADRRRLAYPRRFIPAYTGNSRGSRPGRPSPPVHPRVHGELRPGIGRADGWGGSSPRTRGTPILCDRYPLWCRFIPAYTGNSSRSLPHRSSPTVHPRVHGELEKKEILISTRYGSSPRTRGTLSGCAHYEAPDRFIPAYTGNSAMSKSAPS